MLNSGVNRLFFRFNRINFNMVSTLKLTDYDVIGLDLDNTLLHYNLTNFINLQYNFMSTYLTDKKGYNKTVFPDKLTENNIDFIQRGLFLDFKRGNLLHLRNDGFILKATHGSRKMEDSLIEKIYDYTDSITSLLFAQAVDAVDLQGHPEEYVVWPDVLEALVQMYQEDSSFIQAIAINLLDYMKPCDEDVRNWLQNLKKCSKLILITGSDIEVAKISLPLCLGENYSEFFDIIIYNAKKPGFFNLSRPFLTTDNEQVHDIVLGKHFKQGNWSELFKMFAALLKKSPKCLYIGDNPLQDVFTPATIPEKIDVIALIEEVAAEGLYPGYPQHPHSKYISSKFWESFLYSDQILTFYGGIIKTKAKLIIPSLKVLAEKPLDYEHKSIL
ncbi:5'-nucleotidase domain-containing protein 1 isoform X2 [Halyomorpha halys]|uniref:5'-nucleotidase domain-containing protein 1 isoform X2 n=1 Tax=Halyomorpha halys TaxID=286706 RepID=UPI0006D51A37|nr:5'-nucleotidase domain-containing protein 1-like isoform X2 [Halyomorpha halys]